MLRKWLAYAWIVVAALFIGTVWPGDDADWSTGLGLLVGVVSVYLAIRASGQTVNAAGPSGLGGWLLLLAIGQTLFPLRTLADLAKSGDAYSRLMTFERGPLAVYGDVGLTVAFAALQFVVAIFMYRRSRLFPKLFMYQWIAIPAFLILESLLVSASLGVPIDQVLSPGAVSRTTGAFLFGGLWVWYVFKSVRVRNTFVR